MTRSRLTGGSAGHGQPSSCVRRQSDRNNLTEKDYEALEYTSWSKPLYIIGDQDSESISQEGLIRRDQLIIGVAHAQQTTNKKTGTKAKRFVALGRRVMEILDSLRFTIWIGGATRGQAAIMRRLKNPGPESWEKILKSIMDNLAPERDDDEETGGGTDFEESNHSELQPDVMIIKKIGDLRAWANTDTAVDNAKAAAATALAARLKRTNEALAGANGFDLDDDPENDGRSATAQRERRRRLSTSQTFAQGFADVGAAELLEAQRQTDMAAKELELKERELKLRERAQAAQLQMQEAMLRRVGWTPESAAKAAAQSPRFA